MTTLTKTNSIIRSPLRAFLLIPFVLACFALSPRVQAVVPAPDGGYPNFNTAEGQDALFALTTGFGNTATGFDALFSNTAGFANTANGYLALNLNTAGNFNTANGAQTLLFNTTGGDNTATGAQALLNNTIGNFNTATGTNTLSFNTTGNGNTANGFFALNLNTTGRHNTASGANALLSNTTGSNNIAVGLRAGQNLTTGDDNIDIGNAGVRDESDTIRIGTVGTHTNTFIAGISGVTVAGGVGVIIDTNGKLGTVVSSERFKDAVKPMDRASEAILSLKPVTFHYKHELDPAGIPQFGLVAEEVEKVNPDLVARDDHGKPYAVRYEAVNAMLLNEFIKEHRKNEAQQKQIEALIAMVKEQAGQIQKVSAQIALSKPAPRTVANNQ